MSFLVEDDEFTGRFDRALWTRILKHLVPFRSHLFTLGATGIAVAMIDVMLPLVTAWLIDEATGQGDAGRLVPLSVVYAFLCLIFSALIFWFIDLAGRIATGVAFELRKTGFGHLQRLDFSFFDHRPVGWLVTRLTSDCTKLSDLIPWFFLDFAWGICFLLGIAVTMLFLNWKLALLVMIIIPPLIVVTLRFQKWLLESSRSMRKTNSDLTASFNECIMGVVTTKSLGRVPEPGGIQGGE